MALEWHRLGRPKSLGFSTGVLAGLVAITPASGFVTPAAAIPIGMIAGIIYYGAVELKGKLGYGDSLDVFGVHGVGLTRHSMVRSHIIFDLTTGKRFTCIFVNFTYPVQSGYSP